MVSEKNRGTETATAIIYETIAAAKSQKLKTNIILRDISLRLYIY